MKKLDPYVKLINKIDGREHAWKVSRPGLNGVESHLKLQEIYNMDLSLNSLKIFILEFQSSTIFRDLIFSLRPLDGWALSTRSLNLTIDSLAISSEFNDEKGYESGIEMIKRCLNGESRDKTRDLLPATTSTKYTVSMNYRIVIALCKSLFQLNKKLYDLYGKMILTATDISEQEMLNSSIKPIHPFIQITEKEYESGVKSVGEITFGSYRVKLALASQFLRQHYAKVKIEYWNFIDNYFEYMPLQREKIRIVFYTDNTAYHNLMAMRCHWALDWSLDMWGSIASDYIKNMNAKEFWNFIPNGAGKKDPYWADVYNRVTGADPGIPCPIMCEWPELVELKANDIGESPILDKYYELIKHGFIKDNPDNKYRKMYLEKKHGT